MADGRVYAGASTYRGMTVFRPVSLNWRTTIAEVELLVKVLHELAGALS